MLLERRDTKSGSSSPSLESVTINLFEKVVNKTIKASSNNNETVNALYDVYTHLLPFPSALVMVLQTLDESLDFALDPLPEEKCLCQARIIGVPQTLNNVHLYNMLVQGEDDATAKVILGTVLRRIWEPEYFNHPEMFDKFLKMIGSEKIVESLKMSKKGQLLAMVYNAIGYVAEKEIDKEHASSTKRRGQISIEEIAQILLKEEVLEVMDKFSGEKGKKLVYAAANMLYKTSDPGALRKLLHLIKKYDEKLPDEVNGIIECVDKIAVETENGSQVRMVLAKVEESIYLFRPYKRLGKQVIESLEKFSCKTGYAENCYAYMNAINQEEIIDLVENLSSKERTSFFDAVNDFALATGDEKMVKRFVRLVQNEGWGNCSLSVKKTRDIAKIMGRNRSTEGVLGIVEKFHGLSRYLALQRLHHLAKSASSPTSIEKEIERYAQAKTSYQRAVVLFQSWL